jgi:hypothetical protein
MYHFRKASAVVHGFITECSNDKDISLVIPGLDVLSKHCKTLKINLLGVHERPKYKRDVDKLNSAADRKYMVFTSVQVVCLVAQLRTISFRNQFLNIFYPESHLFKI